MIDQKHKDTLSGVICRILEDGAFIFAEEPDEQPSAQDLQQAKGVALSFTGPRTGAVRMWVPDAFASYAAANMLGLEPDEDDAAQKGRDALRELLNMIVGNYLTEQFGVDQVFDLSLPEDVPPDLLHEDLGSDDTVWLDAEGNHILFRLVVQT
jgi:CheY-specific phosphatase CheX